MEKNPTKLLFLESFLELLFFAYEVTIYTKHTMLVLVMLFICLEKN